MKEQCMLSLCIPTNGVVEWVIPVLDSIFQQNVDESLYEVCVSDNGTDTKFKQIMGEYMSKYSNLHYQESDASGFLNQVESFRMAEGKLIKFVNHRMSFLDGTLQYLVDLATKYQESRPVIYFLNGNLDLGAQQLCLNNFDEFVYHLSYYSSWSAGLAFWNDKKDEMLQLGHYNTLFPHIDFLLYDRDSSAYIIENKVIQRDVHVDSTKKGRYNLFFAFGVEYPSVILDLLRSNDITIGTFQKVIRENGQFLVDLYYEYILRKRPASYLLDDYKEYLNVFYREKEIKKGARKRLVKQIWWKLLRILRLMK